jgi:hypothetical protein
MNEMSRSCSTYGGEERGRDHLEDPGVDGKIILRWIFRKWGIEWIELAQDRDRWRALKKRGSEPSGSIECGEFLD